MGFRAFTATSYWNTALPAGAPVDPESDDMIGYLERENAGDYVQLTGTGSDGQFGMPIYWASPIDPTYRVRNTCKYPQPPAFNSVRIPKGAEPDPSSDSELTVYDTHRGVVYGLWHSRYDAATDAWSSCGGTVYYLSSNGLAATAAGTDDKRNSGHRGVPPPAYAVRWDEIGAGSIDHVLKIAIDQTRCEHVFPMVGDECGTHAFFAPPEGTRIRIDPSIDLATLGLSPPALIIARALQTYGAVIGDQSGQTVNLKLENTVAEGGGQLWDGVLSMDSLRAVPLSDFQVIKLGYYP